ncbi:fused MFS/spermidine synthase [Rhodococcus antarcticus]|uniref:Fused MFS/spermidine synthase n=1 Tax=Rhodococcus antarcticus TaxID=2987751 RepID=A0ABY6P3R5_9NOCA|nr:fused MFS/spermidine synthase [Rhodococcus antarcticus]UZJ26300.1 fused MFS/spermidine synthase [Rhodococcus antarcticus]
MSLSAPRVQVDPARPGGRILLQGEVWQSYTDLDDPEHLHFAYTQRIADAVDTVLPRPGAVRAVHLGGGAMTLPRWLAATRPGSRSTVLELDPEVVAAAMALVHVPAATVRVGDARAGLEGLADGCADLVVGDAFDGRAVPPHLLTTGCTTEVVRVLRPGGLYVLNIIGDAPFVGLRGALATVRAAFGHVGVLAAPELLAQEVSGNAVVVACDEPVDWSALASRAAQRAERPTVLGESGTAHWVAGAAVLVD